MGVGEATSEYGGQVMRYWTEFRSAACYAGADGTCNPAVGQKTAADPHGYIDGPPAYPGVGSLKSTLGTQRSFASIMLLCPHVREIVNSDDVIEYVDRLHRHGLWASPDPVNPITIVDDQSSTCDTWGANAGEGCLGFRTAWGPREDDVRFAISNETQSRFEADAHGSAVNPTYTSALTELHWDVIIQRYDGFTYEDNFVNTNISSIVAPSICTIPNFATNTSVMHLWCPTFDANPSYIQGNDIQWTQYIAPITVPSNTQVTARCVKLDNQGGYLLSQNRSVVTHSALNSERCSYNGGDFFLVFRQRATSDSSLIPPDAPLSSLNSVDDKGDLYSILDTLEKYRTYEGAFVFRMWWPNPTNSSADHLIWKQTSNPATSNDSNVTDYMLLEDTTGGNPEFMGLAASSSSFARIDGCPHLPWWYYSIGVSAWWDGGIPAYSRIPAKSVELFVWRNCSDLN